METHEKRNVTHGNLGSERMRWYDYIVCVGCADFIAASIVNYDIFTFIASGCAYLFWETFREWEIHDGKR
jgi:hypothetical protein